MPDPFVESLQHDSIIVQIPLLHGRVNNRLEKVLSVFDQSNVADDNKVVRIDEHQFDGDSEMEYVVRRLLSAASDPDMRYQMNVEDEYFQELEDRDTAIMERDKIIRDREEQISRKDEQLSRQNEQLSRQNEQLSQKDAQIEAQKGMLRKMVLKLRGNGMNDEAIAEMLGISEGEVRGM